MSGQNIFGVRVRYGGGVFSLAFHFNGKAKCLQGLKAFMTSLIFVWCMMRSTANISVLFYVLYHAGFK